ncbi:MAG: 2-amino-4-hydroxy-6-hydroxymethyldihydropteridine diphosphokinase [Ignavibacteriales bacterium]
MNNVFLALGSNKGNKIEFIRKAIKLLSEENGNEILKISSMYFTKPYGNVEQENFVNMVLQLRTELDLKSFHEFCKKTELKIGREKTIKWGPREIDLDILLFNDLIIESDNLTLPHKEILNRDFFLVPLVEIAPDLLNPKTKILFKEHLNSLRENYILAKEIFNTNLKGN